MGLDFPNGQSIFLGFVFIIPASSETVATKWAKVAVMYYDSTSYIV